MPRGKSTTPPLLAASDKYRRASERLAQSKKDLQKAEAAYAEAETGYLTLAAETFAARQRALAPAGQEAPAANA